MFHFLTFKCLIFQAEVFLYLVCKITKTVYREGWEEVCYFRYRICLEHSTAAFLGFCIVLQSYFQRLHVFKSHLRVL